jgi:hypothetical protein
MEGLVHRACGTLLTSLIKKIKGRGDARVSEIRVAI